MNPKVVSRYETKKPCREFWKDNVVLWLSWLDAALATAQKERQDAHEEKSYGDTSWKTWILNLVGTKPGGTVEYLRTHIAICEQCTRETETLWMKGGEVQKVETYQRKQRPLHKEDALVTWTSWGHGGVDEMILFFIGANPYAWVSRTVVEVSLALESKDPSRAQEAASAGWHSDWNPKRLL
jgi:hypothetical protein